MESRPCPNCGSPRPSDVVACPACGPSDVAAPVSVASVASVPEGPDGYDDLLDLLAALPPAVPTPAAVPAGASPVPPVPTVVPRRHRRTALVVGAWIGVAALVVAVGLGAGVVAGTLIDPGAGAGSAAAASVAPSVPSGDDLVDVTTPPALATAPVAAATPEAPSVPVSPVASSAAALPSASAQPSPPASPASSVAPTPAPPTSAQPPDGAWSRAADLPAARWGMGSAVLPDGRILVVGGSTGKTSWGASARADIYDPATGAWSRAADLPEARTQPTVVALPDDEGVLVVGGSSDQVPLATAFVYRPGRGGAGAGTWTTVGAMSVGRVLATATVLPSGRVLVVGGGSTGLVKADPAASWAATATAEVFDPTTMTWTRTAPMASARAVHTATRLPDGRILVAGGATKWTGLKGGKVLASSEIFDESTGAWTPAADLAGPRYAHASAALPDGAYAGGSVVVAGGWGRDRGDARDTAEVYDVAADRWTMAPGRMSEARAQLALVALDGGWLLAVGGSVDARTITGACDLFDVIGGTWSPTGSIEPGVVWGAVAQAGDGEVLVASGATGMAAAGVSATTPRSRIYAVTGR